MSTLVLQLIDVSLKCMKNNRKINKAFSKEYKNNFCNIVTKIRISGMKILNFRNSNFDHLPNNVITPKN